MTIYTQNELIGMAADRESRLPPFLILYIGGAIMSLHETNAMVSYFLIVAFYKSLFEQNRITEKQFEKACKGLAVDMKVKDKAA